MSVSRMLVSKHYGVDPPDIDFPRGRLTERRRRTVYGTGILVKTYVLS